MRLRTLCLCIGGLTLFAACDDDLTSAPAPDPPTVSTGVALSVGRDQAAISGTVDPHGVDTVYWFEYGTDASYGIRTPDAHASTALGAQEVAAPLTNLTPATVYHYRLAASNSAGTAWGIDAVFRTLDPNEPPDTQLAAAGSDTLDTTVRWHLFWNGLDPDGEVVGYELRVADHGPDGMLDPADSLGVPWTSTVVTDSLLTWQDGLGSRTVWIRAFDDEDARDPTPASAAITAIE